MGKHARRVQDRPVKVDPSQSLAWRGIGCLLMLIIPAISIFAASLTISGAVGAYIPYQLMGYPILPDYLFSTPGLSIIFSPIANTENLYALIVVSAMYMMVLGGLISLLYAVIYRMVNPKRYGPYDAPPPNVRAKKYKR